MIANALFADGAAAVVGTGAADTALDCWQQNASGSYVFPRSAGAMTWTIGEHGFSLNLSKRIPFLIQSSLARVDGGMVGPTTNFPS